MELGNRAEESFLANFVTSDHDIPKVNQPRIAKTAAARSPTRSPLRRRLDKAASPSATVLPTPPQAPTNHSPIFRGFFAISSHVASSHP
jgi:hypothetical protein